MHLHSLLPCALLGALCACAQPADPYEAPIDAGTIEDPSQSTVDPMDPRMPNDAVDAGSQGSWDDDPVPPMNDPGGGMPGGGTPSLPDGGSPEDIIQDILDMFGGGGGGFPGFPGGGGNDDDDAGASAGDGNTSADDAGTTTTESCAADEVAAPGTSLCFARCASGQTWNADASSCDGSVSELSFADAQAACSALGGGSRLPSATEVRFVLGGCSGSDNAGYVCDSCAESTACAGMFGVEGGLYWTETPVAGGVLQADLDVEDAPGEHAARLTKAATSAIAAVRCVRIAP